MSVLISYVDQYFPMDKLFSVQNIPLAILVVCLVEFIFFQIDLNCFQRVCKHFSRLFSSIQYQTVKLSDIFTEKVKLDDFEFTKRNPLLSQQVDDGSLCREDMEMVMGRLGFFCHPRQDKMLQQRLGIQHFSSMFQDNEPSLDEVKEAFDVFDLNRDGFIDAMELQRVLCVLGLSHQSQIENCKQMIREFDENRDGRIDFREFLKLMENSFC
ncbi:putative calcium-binding protein CML45 [Heracleum sosnowskyi]|uniref:Calcium-binding protein CML45 n=1 Tax=Heracleum sosnowskyi TaxID=360622 RepID=A0AAD8GMG3_9APIA|nr:putative calcium-binding protein CML45 [Heracleum sosnowskyi]